MPGPPHSILIRSLTSRLCLGLAWGRRRRERISRFQTDTLNHIIRLKTHTLNKIKYKIIQNAPGVTMPIKMSSFSKSILTRSERIDAVICHDVFPLPAALALAKKHAAPLIYDAIEIPLLHERTGPFFQDSPLLLRAYLHRQHDQIIKKCDHVTTVSPTLGAWLQGRYDVPVTILTNARPRADFCPSDNIRADIGLSPREELIVAVGNQQQGNGLERIADILRSLPHVHLATLGSVSPDFQKQLKCLAPLGRYHHLGIKQWAELPTYISGASLGVIPWQNSPHLPLNIRVALPNRIFDYVAARLPIVSTDCAPAIRDIILDYCIGEVSCGDIASSLRKVLDHPQGYAPALERAAKSLIAENETPKFLSLLPTDAQIIAFVTIKDPSKNARMQRMAKALLKRDSTPVFYSTNTASGPH